MLFDSIKVLNTIILQYVITNLTNNDIKEMYVNVLTSVDLTFMLPIKTSTSSRFSSLMLEAEI